MKIYTLTEVRYDWHEFETLVDVSSDFFSLLSSPNIEDNTPVFSEEETCARDFTPPSSDGLSHYYWTEWTV